MLMIAALIAALAFWVRYAGITCIITGGVLLLFSGNLSLKKKLLHLISFGTLGVLFTLVNLIRNSLVTGTYTGVRETALRSIVDNIADLGIVLREWFPLAASLPWLTIVLLVIVLLVAIGLIGYRIVQQQFFASFEMIIATFVVIYTSFMLVIASISRFETLSSRLMSPVYVPLLVLLGIIATKLLHNRHWLFRVVLSFFLLSTYGFAQYHHYTINRFNWEGIHTAGIPGYTEDQWTQSPMMAYLRWHAKEYLPVIFSNTNDAVYFLTGLNALSLPHKDVPGEIIRFRNNPSFYLVWFFYGENPDLIDREFIQQHFTLKASWQFEDGIIYRY
jgi:hypothetical protein